MKVGSVHAAPVMLDLERSIQAAVAWVESAAQEGIELLVFPESFLPGFPYWVNMVPSGAASSLFKALYQNAVPTESLEQTLAPITEVCHRGGVSTVIGFNERQGGTIFNALAFIDGRTGRIRLVRRKLVPTAGERSVWGHGDASTLHAAELGGVRVSGMMCFEHTMHLARHALSVEDASIHTAAWPGLAGMTGYGALFHEQVSALIRSYAIMAQTFVVSAMNPISEVVLDRIAQEIPDLGLIQPSRAWSAVISPQGRIVAEYEGSTEQILAADIDLEERIGTKRVLDTGHFGRSECFTLQVNRRPFSSGNVVDV